MNLQIVIKAPYESRIVFRGIQHLIAFTCVSNIWIIFVIVNKGSSQFGSLLYTEISTEGTCKMLSFSQKQLLCTETAASSAVTPALLREPRSPSGESGCLSVPGTSKSGRTALNCSEDRTLNWDFADIWLCQGSCTNPSLESRRAICVFQLFHQLTAVFELAEQKCRMLCATVRGVAENIFCPRLQASFPLFFMLLTWVDKNLTLRENKTRAKSLYPHQEEGP